MQKVYKILIMASGSDYLKHMSINALRSSTPMDKKPFILPNLINTV